MVLIDISTSHNVDSPRSLRFNFCQMIDLFRMFIMLWICHLCGWLHSHELSKIMAKLAMSLKRNVIFAQFLEMLSYNNVTSLLTTFVHEAKIIGKSFDLVFSRFLFYFIFLLKMHFKNLMRLGFRWLAKSIETIKLYNRIFGCSYSLCFYISMVQHWNSATSKKAILK